MSLADNNLDGPIVHALRTFVNHCALTCMNALLFHHFTCIVSTTQAASVQPSIL